jgi:hypothetical protein
MEHQRPPEQSEYERAKELYIAFRGSGFGMGRDGFLEEYKQYNVEPAQERQWRAESIDALVRQLSPNNTGAIVALSVWEAKEALPALLDQADEGHDYARLIRANTLWELGTHPKPARAPDIDPALERAAGATALRIWQEIVEAESINLGGNTWQPWDRSNPEDFIRRWARRNLEGLPSGQFHI